MRTQSSAYAPRLNTFNRLKDLMTFNRYDTMSSLEARVDALEKRVLALEGGKPKKVREPSAYQVFVKTRYAELKDDVKFAQYEGKAKFIAINKACAEEWKKQQK